MIVIEGLNTFWEETRNYHIPHMMMTLKGKFKGENNLKLCSVGRPNKEWYTYKKVDQSDNLLPM